MAEKESSGIADEAKGLAQDFVGAIGLLELVLGSVAMYGVRLLYGAPMTQLFPSTGVTFVDVGLLALGAALIGSVVELLVSIILAIGRWTIVHWDPLGYQGRIETALSQAGLLAPSDQKSPPAAKKDQIDLGLYYVTLKDSTQRAFFEHLRTRTVIAYSTSILVFPYLLHFWEADAPTGIIMLALLGAPLLLLRGFFEQLDLFKSLAERLEVIQQHKT